jgi:hypothetical protein
MGLFSGFKLKIPIIGDALQALANSPFGPLVQTVAPAFGPPGMAFSALLAATKDDGAISLDDAPKIAPAFIPGGGALGGVAGKAATSGKLAGLLS